MTLNTLDRVRTLMNFRADRHFIYITTHVDEIKEELQSYYKLTEEDLEEITKEWPAEFLIPVDQATLSDPNLIRSPVVSCKEYDAPKNSRKNKEDVQEIHNISEETTSDSPSRGEDNEVDKEEKEGEEDKKRQGKLTPPRKPLVEVEISKKIKVFVMKPTLQKKSKVSKLRLQTMLTFDDFDFIIAAISYASKDIL
jgi:hypothetical protein